MRRDLKGKISAATLFQLRRDDDGEAQGKDNGGFPTIGSGTVDFPGRGNASATGNSQARHGWHDTVALGSGQVAFMCLIGVYNYVFLKLLLNV